METKNQLRRRLLAEIENVKCQKAAAENQRNAAHKTEIARLKNIIREATKHIPIKVGELVETPRDSGFVVAATKALLTVDVKIASNATIAFQPKDFDRSLVERAI